MNQTIAIIKEVCNKLDLRSKFIDSSNLVLVVNFKNGSHIFIANNSGLNNEAVRKICNDKFYSYLLLKNKIKLPKTLSFVDPKSIDIYQKYSCFKSNKEVAKVICNNHTWPILIKPNSLYRGINVFKCENQSQVLSAVETIFNKNNLYYDHVLISQDFIEAKQEYRVVVYNKKIIFVYTKQNSNGQFIGNISPLHWKNSKAILVQNKDIIKKLNHFITPIFSILNLRYAGIDIIKDSDDKLWLIEINSQPGFNFFIKDNSKKEIIKMYTKILSDLKNIYD